MSQPLLELEGGDASFRLVGGEGMPKRVAARPLGTQISPEILRYLTLRNNYNMAY